MVELIGLVGKIGGTVKIGMILRIQAVDLLLGLLGAFGRMVHLVGNIAEIRRSLRII